MSASNPVHPKVKAAGAAGAALALAFTVLAAVGVVVPQDVQDAGSVVVADVALLVPAAVGWLKRP